MGTTGTGGVSGVSCVPKKPGDAGAILAENERRKKALFSTYEPTTGEGCRGDRFLLETRDAPFRRLWLPRSMEGLPAVRVMLESGSMRRALEEAGMEVSPGSMELFWTWFCEERARRDFEYFAFTWVTIMDGSTAELVPFRLNRGQRRLLEALEGSRERGAPIRVILLKARQWGGSTLVEIYMLWIQVVLRRNWNSVVCAHLDHSATVIREMLTGALGRMQEFGGRRFASRGFEGTRNIKFIEGRGCTIMVGSAESPDSVRAQNVKMAHFSEVALYPDTDKKATSSLIGAVIGTLKLVELSLVVYESTARGVGDFFHEEWLKAERGESPFLPVFVEWFLIDAYREGLDKGYFTGPNGRRVEGDAAGFARSLDEGELAFFRGNEGVTLESLNWYRGKRAEFSHAYLMLQEYPSSALEAFQGSGSPVFRREDVEAQRRYCRDPRAIGRLSSACPPELARGERWRNGDILKGLAFVADGEAMERYAAGDARERLLASRERVKVWAFPESTPRVRGRYAVIFDPQRGLSESADWGVILVLDRYWMMEGGVPEVVAEWRGKVDKDVAIWKAVQLARWYDDALLVVECNTYDTDTRDDYSEFIFDTVAGFYDNIYSRTGADKVKEGVPVEYGFHMNRSTKPMVVSDYTAVLRERGYREREAGALEEALLYEKKDNGRYEAKKGYHDDRLVTRMVGCWICYRMEMPVVVERGRESGERVVVGVSSV
jgi:hypothetical protein